MSLLSTIMATQGGGQSIFATMMLAVLPIVKVFTMCFMGFLMASKYVNILPANGRKLLNGLVFSLLLPCLIFSQLGRAITFQRIMEWWFIPINIILATISGSLIGFLVASVVRPPYPYFKFTIVHIGIGNIGNIPLVLIAALCRDASNPFGDSDKCSVDGTAYISFGQWVGAIVLYTYVFQMLAPPPGGSFDCTDKNVLPAKNLLPNPPPEQVPLLSAKEPEPSEVDSPRRGRIIHILCALVEKLKLKQILQPPIIASILAIFIGSVPFLKNLILTDDAPFFFFTDSCIILGEAMIPCILLALGGNLVDGPGPGSSKLGLRTTVAIVFGRLVLIPPAGLGIVTLAEKLGFLPAGNKMFKFVLLLQHTMPTSVLSVASWKTLVIFSSLPMHNCRCCCQSQRLRERGRCGALLGTHLCSFLHGWMDNFVFQDTLLVGVSHSGHADLSPSPQCVDHSIDLHIDNSSRCSSNHDASSSVFRALAV